MIDLPVASRHRERDQGISQLRRTLDANSMDDASESGTFGRGQATHDAQVDIDDLPLADDDVTRVRVGMEEAMIKNLRGVVVQQLFADFRQIITSSKQLVAMRDVDAFDILHDQHVLARILGVHVRRVDENAVFVQLLERLEVLGLAAEIGFLDEGVPHLLDNLFEVDHRIALGESAHLVRKTAHDVDILRHGELNAGALDFHGDRFTRDQLGLMNLSKRRASQRLRIDRLEDFPVPFAINGTKRHEYLLERERIAFGLKFGELLAIRLGQDFRTSGQRLTDFHEAGTKLLERRAELFRSELV